MLPEAIGLAREAHFLVVCQHAEVTRDVFLQVQLLGFVVFDVRKLVTFLEFDYELVPLSVGVHGPFKVRVESVSCEFLWRPAVLFLF